MTLWGGRFTTRLDQKAWDLNTSLPFDQRLANQDVRGSIAWADALVNTGILTIEEHAAITNGLLLITDELKNGKFTFREDDEDIHTAVERRLGELIGAAGGKLHTGRSRNDQVATDFRLWLLDALPLLDDAIQELQSTLITVAEQNATILMPGYTHLQRAQPVLFAHWLMSYFWMFQRDRDRLTDLRDRVAVMPLGCGALAGTAFTIDREVLAAALGFDTPAQNSLDAVSDRDFAAEALFCTALTGVHLGRLSEAVVLFTTAEFGFFELADAFSTGSSLMPQKKNADLFELARGKAGTLIGLLTGLLATLKSLPSAYDKDLQEDKVPVFQAVDTLLAILPVLAKALATMVIRPEKMLEAIDPNMLATDFADFLVHDGVPFREAHALVGKMVRLAAEKGVPLDEFVTAEWSGSRDSGLDFSKVFNPLESVKRRSAIGGTSPVSVRKQIVQAKALITKDKL